MNLPSPRNKDISSFTLKIIAILGMTTDHLGVVFHAYLPTEILCVLFAFGGLTFPIMAFLINEGYRHTSNLKRYALRLLAFALVAQIPYSLFLAHYGNVLFTLLLGLGVIYAYDTLKSRTQFWLLFALAVLVSASLDWSFVGVPMILMYHVISHKRAKVLAPLILPALLFLMPSLAAVALTQSIEFLPDALYVLVGCTLTIPLLLHYEGRRGRPMKYFFYVYYPIHIAVLGLIRWLAFGDAPL